MKKLVYLFTFVGIVSCFVACGGKKSERSQKSSMEEFIEQDPRHATAMTRTSQDTTTVMQLSRQYLDLLVKNEVESAVDMLYELRSDSLYPMAKERKKEMISLYQTFPVLSYEIESFSLYTESDTEVRFAYEFMQKPEGSDIPNVMRGSLCPIRHAGQWYLTIPKEQFSMKADDYE